MSLRLPFREARPEQGRWKIWPGVLSAAATAVSVCLALPLISGARGQEAAVPGRPGGSELRTVRRDTPLPGNRMRGYKGLLLADVNTENAYKDEVIADLGSLGLWVYEQLTWTQISPVDPDWIMAASLNGSPKKSIIADLGDKGLWKWTYDGYPGEWVQLTGRNPLWAIALDDDNDKRQELHVVFGTPPGIWRYDEASGAGSWKQISALTPAFGLRTAAKPGGPEEGVYAFPGRGVWTINCAGGEIHTEQLTGTECASDDNVSARFTGGPAEDLVTDFGAKGMWLCRNSDHAWHQIIDRRADRVVAVRFGPGNPGLVLDLNGDEGLYYWNFDGFPGKLTRLRPNSPDTGFCEPFDRDGKSQKNDGQELAVDFGNDGLWVLKLQTNTWALINTKNPVFMVGGDYWGVGYDSTLAVSFGNDGIWLYEGKSGGWYQISKNAPDRGL
jgi:hypothetical protein